MPLLGAEPVYRPIIQTAILTFRALGLDIDDTGREHVPATGGAVVAMNHLSYLDFMLAGVPFWYGQHRLVRFMAKREVFDHPVAGPLMRGMKHIPVDRGAGAQAYRAAVDALARGELVGVFPEATISRSWCLKDFKSGAVRMAQEAGVPVLPLVLWGSQRVLTKGARRDLLGARGTHISIDVGEPLAAPAGEDAAALTSALHVRMSAMLDAAQRAYPTPGAGQRWQPAHLGGTAPTLQEAAALEAAEARAKAERREAKAGTGA